MLNFVAAKTFLNISKTASESDTSIYGYGLKKDLVLIKSQTQNIFQLYNKRIVVLLSHKFSIYPKLASHFLETLFSVTI